MRLTNTNKVESIFTRQGSLLAALDDMVSIVDKNYRYIAVSSGYTRFFGIKRDDIIGKQVSEIHGEERFVNTIKPFLDKTLAGEEVHLNFWGKNHRGELRYLDSKHTPYNGRLTDAPAVAVVARDITELVKVQSALEKERSLLNTMINAIPDFIFTKDKDGIYTNCNASFEEFLGMSKRNIVGKSDFQIMSDTSAQYIKKKDREVFLKKQPLRLDEWVTYKDGRRRLLDMYKLPLFNEMDEVCGIIGIGRNVTHERETEQKLLLAALVFETITDACLILSRSGKILSSNLAAKEQFPELKESDEAPLSITDLFYTSESDTSYLGSILDNRHSWHGEVHSADHRHYIATLNAALDNLGQVEKFVLILRHTSSSRIWEKNLISKAYSDALTGLPNRLIFMNRLEMAINRAERHRRQIAVFFIDLNKFKPINDSYGHFEGDKVLANVAQRLRENVRETDTIARLGGDEFVALIDIDNERQAETVARKMIDCLAEEFEIGPDKHRIKLSASIGISIFPSDAGNAEELLKLADKAMYQAKHTVGMSIRFNQD